MIGKHKNLIRLAIVILILNSVNTIVFAQDLIEDKALKYFCEIIDSEVLSLNGEKFIFNKKTNGKPSRVYDIADCLGDISLIKDSIPDKNYLDSLQIKLKNKKWSVKKLTYESKKFTNGKFSFLNSNTYSLNVYNSIPYKDKIAVELFLHNKREKRYKIFVVMFDKNLEPESHCVQSILYH